MSAQHWSIAERDFLEKIRCPEKLNDGQFQVAVESPLPPELLRNFANKDDAWNYYHALRDLIVAAWNRKTHEIRIALRIMEP